MHLLFSSTFYFFPYSLLQHCIFKLYPIAMFLAFCLQLLHGIPSHPSITLYLSNPLMVGVEVTLDSLPPHTPPLAQHPWTSPLTDLLSTISSPKWHLGANRHTQLNLRLPSRMLQSFYSHQHYMGSTSQPPLPALALFQLSSSL